VAVPRPDFTKSLVSGHRPDITLRCALLLQKFHIAGAFVAFMVYAGFPNLFPDV
jgi:hypothetical protein